MSHALDLETGVFCVNTCEPLRLDAYNVSVELETCAAKVFLKQEYKNVSLKPKKVFYQFLVPTNWSLLHIETHVEETVDTGTIHGTCSDFLHQRIADRAEPLLRVPIAQNVPIGQTVMIALTFVVPVWCRNGGLCDEVTLIIPSSTMPSSSCQILKSAARSEWKDSFSFSCPTRLTAGYQLVVSGKLLRRIKKVDVQGLTTVKNTSKNDSCIDVRAEDRATDLTSKEVKILFQLQAELQDPHNALQAVVCKNSTACESNAEETNVLLCAITPSFRDDMDKKLWQTPNVEYILCLDNHLSMMDKRSDVIRGIQIWLRSLPDACLLNVAIFGPELCFFQPGGSRLVNRNLINECSERYLWSTFTCNNTKRELYNSLLEVYMKPATEGYARQILFVTDGSERNSSARCVQLVASNSDTTRFHAITIGERADRSSFEKMAHATNGQYAHCARSTQFRAVLMKRTRETFHRPCLTNVQITLTSSSEPRIETMVRPCQDVIPLCFGQEQVTALFFSRVIPDDLEVAVVGYIEKRRVTYRIRIDDAKTTTTYGAPNPFLHTFTALNRIQFLTQLQTKSSCSEDEMCEVDRLVSMYHVLSPHHYFEIKGSRLHYMDRPVLPIRPWEPLPQTTLLTPIPDPPCDEPRSTECTSTYLPNRALCRQLLLEHVLRYVCDDPILDDLLFSQQSDGKWLPGCALARHMRVPHSKLLESLEEHRANRNAWVTLMVLLVIQKDFPDQEDEYIAIVEREMKLLTNELGSPEALAALHSQVEAFLSVNRGSE